MKKEITLKKASKKVFPRAELRTQTKKQPVEKEKSLVEKYRSHKSDTGSTEVQIALLSEKMTTLVKHLKKHPKDLDSRRGLLSMIGKRRRLLNYLRRSEPKKYEKIIADLGLRK